MAAAAGCGAGSRSERPNASQRAAAVPPPVQHLAVPAGYRRHTIREAGISVALPIGWQVLGQRDAVFPGALQILTRIDRGFLAPLQALSSPDSPLKLFAFDRHLWHGQSTSVLVARATYGRPGLFGRWAHRMTAGLAHAPGIRGRVRAVRVDLPSGPGLRAEYRTLGGDTIVDYFLAGKDGVWVLMFRTPTRILDAQARAFLRAARTLELAEPIGGPIRRDTPALTS